MRRIENTNVRTQKFLTMKNFNNTILRTMIKTYFTAMCMVLFCTSIDAQTSVVIDTPMDGYTDCAEFGNTVTFTATGYNGANPIDDANIAWTWTGPNGFSSTLISPDLELNSPNYTGEYIVSAKFQSGDVRKDTIDIVVNNIVDWECPKTIIVTPDLNDPDCAKNLLFNGFTINQVFCTGTAYTWDITLSLQSGSGQAADVPPMNPAINNVLLNQTYGAGLSYSDIPFGFHELRIDILSGAEILDQCLTEVRVVESRGNLACNDLINMTLDGDCEAIITPDMILEGDYCFDLFQLDIEEVATGFASSDIGSVMISAPGMYNVTVTGQTGISCWGQILAEDKSAPILDCDTVVMYCSTLGTAPGDEIRGFDRGWVINETVSPSTTEVYNLNLPDIAGEITGVLVNFKANMEDVSNLELRLTSPSGTQNLLVDLGDPGFSSPCTKSNLSVCFRDNANQSYAMFGSPVLCRSTKNALIGSFQPSDFFNQFYGEDAEDMGNTVWQLEVVNNSGSDDILIIEADLQVYTIEGYLLSATEVVESNGCSTGQSTTYEDEQLGTNCEDGFWRHIIRTWRVTNNASGKSATCDQNIYLRQWTVDEIIWPKSYDDLNQPALRCKDLVDSDFDDNGVPLPSRTGEPRVPFGDLCGNFQVTHNDLTFEICGPVAKKTIRSWAVLDWCSGDIVQYDQTIKVIDDQPISISCVPDNLSSSQAASIGYDLALDAYTATSNPYTCDGNWKIVPPIITDNACGDDLSLRVFYLLDNDDDPTVPPVNGAYIQTNVYDEQGRQVNDVFSSGIPYEIRGIPVGRRAWIKMVVTDECGNTGECFTEVDVVDKTKPIPVCIEYTVAAFGETGIAKVHAESLDNGSWDNCGVVSYEIKGANESNFAYRATYEFGCSCQNPNRIMHLRVTDAAGNTNTCQVEVELQDNLPPQEVQTPQRSFTFDCTESPVDINSIIDQSLTEFVWVDNCFNRNLQNPELNLKVVVVNESQARSPFEAQGCGVGQRSVRYQVLDQCNDVLDDFTQTFSYTNASVSNPNNFQVSRWPQDYIVSNCSDIAGLEPYNLPFQNGADYIIVNSSICNDIAIGWDDTIFPEVQDACLKILREWTVIDWCLAERTSIAQATRTHIQVIKIDDNTPPDINVTGNLTIESKTESCLTVIDTSALVADITDTCTDMFDTQDITYNYRIQFPDGSFSSTITSMDANGAYPFGLSTIYWYAEDHCGNVFETTTRVNVIDRKAPTPYCLGSVVTATMNTNGSAEIWASDFDLGGFDNYTGNADCNNFNSLDVYFLDGNTKTYFLIFDCDDILNGISQVLPLNVYYEDEYGNRDFCIVQLNLQDNQSDLCPDIAGSKIAGNVKTEFSENLENVSVTIRNMNVDFTNVDVTEANGRYAFEDIPTSTDYEISGRMDDDPLNGVSTLDLVLIQRHILGLSSLNSPYKLIAADADNSGSLSALDLLTIRKLILGITEEFPNGQQAWRFPDQGQAFLDVQSPFPYSETIDIFNLQGDMNNQNFVAVKIGDVNASADLKFQGIEREGERRSPANLDLVTDEVSLVRGERVRIPFFAKNIEEVVGFQNTFNFDTERLEFVGVESSSIDLNEENLGTAYLNEGMVSLSWNTINESNVDSDEVLFELIFDVKESSQLSDELYISSNLTKMEAYDSDLRIMDMSIEFRGQESKEFVLFQNVPNPFLETTDIRFRLPESSNVKFTVFDVTGRVLLQDKSRYDAGMHTLRLSREQLNSTGVMYYKIETDYGTDSRKMIQIR